MNRTEMTVPQTMWCQKAHSKNYFVVPRTTFFVVPSIFYYKSYIKTLPNHSLKGFQRWRWLSLRSVPHNAELAIWLPKIRYGNR